MLTATDSLSCKQSTSQAARCNTVEGALLADALAATMLCTITAHLRTQCDMLRSSCQPQLLVRIVCAVQMNIQRSRAMCCSRCAAPACMQLFYALSGTHTHILLQKHSTTVQRIRRKCHTYTQAAPLARCSQGCAAPLAGGTPLAARI